MNVKDHEDIFSKSMGRDSQHQLTGQCHNKSALKERNPLEQIFVNGIVVNLDCVNDIVDNLDYSSKVKYNNPYFNHNKIKDKDIKYQHKLSVEQG